MFSNLFAAFFVFVKHALFTFRFVCADVSIVVRVAHGDDFFTDITEENELGITTRIRKLSRNC